MSRRNPVFDCELSGSSWTQSPGMWKDSTRPDLFNSEWVKRFLLTVSWLSSCHIDSMILWIPNTAGRCVEVTNFLNQTSWTSVNWLSKFQVFHPMNLQTSAKDARNNTASWRRSWLLWPWARPRDGFHSKGLRLSVEDFKKQRFWGYIKRRVFYLRSLMLVAIHYFLKGLSNSINPQVFMNT